MDRSIRQAMDLGGVADITTRGRRTGRPHRVEIYFHQFDGDYYLTGRPGRKRDWEANIEEEPRFTLHLKRGASADVAVRGETGIEKSERARILRRAMIESWGSDPDRVEGAIDRWVESAPFVRFRPSDG